MPDGPGGERRTEAQPEGRPASAGRPSGATATERGRRTRERILRAATELFSTRGYSATRVQDILHSSGTGKGQFYHYFESKAELGRAVLRYQRTLAIPANDGALGYLDSWGRIAAWFDDILRVATAATVESNAAGLFPVDLTDTTSALGTEYVRTAKLRKRLLTRGLRRMQSAGDLAADAETERLAAFAAAAIEGGLQLARVEGSAEPLRHALGEAYTHLTRFSVEEP